MFAYAQDKGDPMTFLTMRFDKTNGSKQNPKERVNARLNLNLNVSRRAAAFTLMEGLFGIAVMGIVFVSLYTGMTSGFQTLRTSQENLRATQIMVDKFENLRLYNWGQITTPGFIPEAFTARFAPNSKSRGIVYTGTVRIAPVTGKPYAVDMRAVTITLSWEANGRPRTQTLTSYVSRFGLQNYIF